MKYMKINKSAFIFKFLFSEDISPLYYVATKKNILLPLTDYAYKLMTAMDKYCEIN